MRLIKRGVVLDSVDGHHVGHWHGSRLSHVEVWVVQSDLWLHRLPHVVVAGRPIRSRSFLLKGERLGHDRLFFGFLSFFILLQQL